MFVAAWLLVPTNSVASPDAKSEAGKKAPAEAKSKPSAVTSSRTKKKSSASSRRKRRTSFKTRLARLKLQPERVMEIQRSLIDVGYLQREPTGKWDSATRDAMLRYQADHGFPATGLPEAKSLMKLGLGPHPLPADLDPTAQARASAETPEPPAADFSDDEDSEISPP
ncbi:MAG: peptidoglycan-binding protein [Acidobacteria bacterium]|nr:peptidoglycan-binding protein [Acidobacteriota bacterium]